MLVNFLLHHFCFTIDCSARQLSASYNCIKMSIALLRAGGWRRGIPPAPLGLRGGYVDSSINGRLGGQPPHIAC